MEAGSDTAMSFLRSLILAMIEFPESQRKAQEEIDRVIGSDRVPTIEDFEHLSTDQRSESCSNYHRLIQPFKTHRFRPNTPLSAPHATLADEEVKPAYLSS